MKTGCYLMGLFTLLLFCPAVCHSTETVSISRFLATASDDDELQSRTKMLQYLQASDDSSWLDGVELRMDIDEFSEDQQEVALRFKPKGWSAIRSEKKLGEARLESYQARRDLLLNRALKRRYITAIDWVYQRKLIQIYAKLIHLNRDRMKVLKRSSEMPGMGSERLSIDFVDAENEVIRLGVSRTEADSRFQFLSDEIRQRIGSSKPVVLDTAAMIGAEGIRRTVQQFRSAPPAENAALRDARLTSGFAEAEYDLEKSENGAWFTFIETGYDLSKKDDFEKAFSLAFGISIPLGVEQRPEIKERKLRLMQAESRVSLLKRQTDERASALFDELSRLLHQYEIIKKSQKTSGSRSMYSIWNKTDGADPLLLLEFKEAMLKGDIILEKLMHRIRTVYIEFLDCTGGLSGKPLYNHLVSGTEVIPL